MKPDKTHEANRLSWNAATRAHNSHKKDQAAFLREGGSTLFPEELELLGNIKGRRMVHLQCNAGQDSLCLARLGADVTGVDISDEAIDFANTLSRDSGIAASFVRADVYEWFAQAHAAQQQFDIAFCSYGAICWLSDLDRWAAGLNDILSANGRFVMVEFHPASMIFDEHFQLKYPYFQESAPQFWKEGVHDYVAASGTALTPSGYKRGEVDFKNPHPAYEFQWPISQVITALIEAELRLEVFREYPYSAGARLFEGMRVEGDRRFLPPEHLPSLPMMYGLIARKAP